MMAHASPGDCGKAFVTAEVFMSGKKPYTAYNEYNYTQYIILQASR